MFTATALIKISTLDFPIKCYVPCIAVVDAQVSRKLRCEQLSGFHILIVEFYFAYRRRMSEFKLTEVDAKGSPLFLSIKLRGTSANSHSYEMSTLHIATL